MTLPGFGRLGYGAAAVGNLYSSLDDDSAHRTLEAAWDGGIRYFDTAPHYGAGLSERRLGRFLRTRERSSYVISTKVGRVLEPNRHYRRGDRDPAGFDVPATAERRWDYSPAGIRRSLADSLDRLGLNHVDILFLHDPDEYSLGAALRDALPELQRMRDEGLVQAVGVGCNSADALAELVAAADLDLIMLAGRYTLLEQPAADRLLPLCVERGVGVIAAGVFNSGILASQHVPPNAHYNYQQAPEALVQRARSLAAVCADHGVELPAAAMQFPLRHRAVQSVVIGARGSQQVSANISASGARIPEDLWRDLAAKGLVPHDGD
jgi:D-threo-aldose 1-dehydrogenase